jgi:hypothetical protein
LVFDGGTFRFSTGSGTTNRNFTINADKTAIIDVSGSVLTISGGSAATNGNLTKSGPGLLQLTGTNLHSGKTTAGPGGGLALVGSGSIANSGVIEIQPGGFFDVSTLTTQLTLAGGQDIQATGTSATGTIATISGKGLTTASDSELKFTAFSGATPPLSIQGSGTLALQSTNPVTVNVVHSGTPLIAGDYKLIAKGTTGTVTGTPTNVQVTGDGVAGTPSLVLINGELFLRVTVPAVPTLDPTNHDFGIVAVGQTTSGFTFTVTNNLSGPSDLTISGITKSGSNTTDFTVGGATFPLVIAKNSSATFTVTFTPGARGPRGSTTLTLANDRSVSLSATVSGTGIAPVAGLSTTSINFGNQSVGTTSSQSAYTITNNGDAGQNLSITSITLTGTNPGEFALVEPAPASPIAPGSSVTLHATFKPTALGARTAILRISSNDPVNPTKDISLSGTGVNPSFRSAATGAWNSNATWEMSNDGGTNWIAATTTPTDANTDSIQIRNGHTVTAQFSVVTIDQTTVDTGGTLAITETTVIVADGPGTDLVNNGTITVNSGIPSAILDNAGTVTNNSTIAINGGLRIRSIGAVYNGAGAYTYSASGGLIFGNPTGSYVVNGSSVFWPAVNGPAGVVISGGGITLSVPRTLDSVGVGGPIIGAGNITANGFFEMNPGGTVDAAPTYGTFSRLRYNIGSFARGPEWKPGANSQPGYPADVDLVNNATLDLPNGSPNSIFYLSRSLAVNSGSSVTLNGATPMTQPLIIGQNVFNSGTITLSANSGINLNGNWVNSGTFVHNNGYVNFVGSFDQSLTGSTTFGDLAIFGSTARTVTFEAGSTQTVVGDLLLQGAAGNLLSLRSSSSPTKWKINAPANQTVAFVNVKDSDASGGQLIAADGNSVDAGNNLNWTFGAPEMNVHNDNYSIPDGFVTPENFGTTGTTFGSVTRRYKVQNLGTANLVLSGTPIVQITGANPGDFTVTMQPTTPIAPGGDIPFDITFDPTAAGTRTATVSIANNDSDENPYNFDLTGFAITAPAPTLGTYAATQVPLGGNTTITPSAAPTDVNSIIVTAPTGFVGNLEANRTTGVVRVTNAHHAKIPAGSYPITVKAIGYGGVTTTTFNLTINTQACGGTSGFTNGTDVAFANIQNAIVMGDFNGDGNQDLAAVLGVTDRIAIYYGDGAANFTFSGSYINVETAPNAAAVGDFDGDGDQEIAVANRSSNNVSIVGIGTTVNIPNIPLSIATGDLNNDGKLDFATANEGSISIRLGDGSGNFTSVPDVTLQSRSLVIGDFNNDGNQDIAATSGEFNRISILIGNGLGGFSVATPAFVDNAPQGIALGDFNGDGKIDLIAANASSNSVSVRLGDGAGAFDGTTEVQVGTNPWSVVVGDFNGDGKQDLAAANRGDDTVSIRYGDGVGGFSGTSDINVGDNPITVAVGDFNEDGRQDFIIANSNTSLASVRLGTCSAPEIAIDGGGVDIPDGDTSATVTGTDFGFQLAGSSITRTYTVSNTGTAPLTLGSLTSSSPSNFVITQSPTSPVAPGGTTTFKVQFNAPFTTGLYTSTISLANTDSNENPYDFLVKGTAAAPEIDVQGNSTSIANGDLTPRTADDTDFSSTPTAGGTVVRTFTILNTGDFPLSLSGTPLIVVGGAHPGDFTVTLQPSSSVNAAASTTFQVTFDPSADGVRTATISIASDDVDENPYNFSIQGTGETAATPTPTPGPTTLVVDNLTDNGVLNQCVTGTPNDCSLRGANSVASDGDTIAFETGLFSFDGESRESAQVITLGGSALSIGSDITIDGPGADELAIDANQLSGVLSISPSASVVLNGLSIINGNSGTNSGGGILNEGALTITDCEIRNNVSLGFGGGIRSVAGSTLTIDRSTISGNRGGRDDIFDFVSDVGGGIDSTAPTVITNSTISGNIGRGLGNVGGGMWLNRDSTISNTTIANNTATGPGASGVFHPANAFTVTVRSSIVAGNVDPANDPDVAGAFVSEGFNIVGNAGTSTGFTNGVNGDLVGTGASPVNPQLEALQVNGGTTLTHKPLPGSPGHDKGCAFGATTDQRGFGRSIDWPHIGNGTCTDTEGVVGLATDIGSVELLLGTAAPVSISGRAVNAIGRGIANATVEIRDTNGNVLKYAFTNSFGYFQLFDVPAGSDYVVTIASKRYRFTQSSYVVSTDDNVDGLLFVASQ